MNFRLKAFGIHLFASAIVLSLTMGVLYLGWYAWPSWYLLGAGTIVGLIVLVDLGLGPLATLLVANPTKPRAELRRDIGLIALIQIAALVYGVMTLWQGRPLYYALTLDRIELVTAANFDQNGLDQATRKGAQIIPSWSTLPTWIWAPLPDDPKQSEAIIAAAISGGNDVTSMPELFRPWDEGIASLRNLLHPMPTLKAKNGLDESAYKQLMDRLGKTESDYGWLLLQGGRHDGTMVFERGSGKPVLFLTATPKLPK